MCPRLSLEPEHSDLGCGDPGQWGVLVQLIQTKPGAWVLGGPGSDPSHS